MTKDLSGISTRDLSSLPDVPTLRRLCRSLAVLDAILCPEWDGRYYSFNAAWAPGEVMASMRDGCGDELFILFAAQGVAIKGLAHESPMYRPGDPLPGILDRVPSTFGAFLQEPAFSMDDVSFCVWRRSEDTAWQHGEPSYPPGDDPDGSEGLLRIFDGAPATYQRWAEGYFEADVDLKAVRQIYAHAPLSAELVRRLAPALSLADLGEDLDEIGYPET